VVGHGLANYLIKRYPVSTVAPYYLLVPVLAVLIGVVFWGDVLTPELITGGLMVMAGVSIITFRSTHKKKIKATDDA
jgi:O-acetylserine/cysteine efflux transporter